MQLKGSFIFYLACLMSLTHMSSSNPQLQNYRGYYSWPNQQQQLALARSTVPATVTQQPIVQPQQRKQQLVTQVTAASTKPTLTADSPVESRSNSFVSHMVRPAGKLIIRHFDNRQRAKEYCNWLFLHWLTWAGGNGTSVGSVRQDSSDSNTTSATSTANKPYNLSKYLGSEATKMLTAAVAFLGAALGRDGCDLKAACLAGNLFPQLQGRDMFMV